MQVNPYLHFAGDCEQAINFYAAALNGTVEAIRRYGGSPLEAQVGEAYKDKVMHASLTAGDVRLMASDSMPGTPPAGPGTKVALSLYTADAAEAARTFDALAAGGVVSMPLQEVFWGGRFGMLTDRFGIRWLMSTD